MFNFLPIYSKLFHHTTNSITDNVGNKCIRSIICVKCDTDVHDTQSENTILYEYKTIAVEERIIESHKKNVYFEPVERRPRMI